MARLAALGAGLALSPAWMNFAQGSKAPQRIVIDPGHGGRDPGAIGLGGTLEKDIVLSVATQLRDELSRITSAEVLLTRDDDRFIRLSDRIGIAEVAGATVFVSIHADWAPEAGAHGVSLYVLSRRASDRLAARLAESQNGVDQINGVDLASLDPATADILIDLALRRTRAEARQLQRGMIEALADRVQLLGNPGRSANFAVLRSAEVPSALIECGFLSNPRDEERLSDPDHRTELAAHLAVALAHSLGQVASL